MLNVINLSFDYAEKPLLEEVSFDLSSGQLLHLKGTNGSGKTTLLKLLAGLLQPQFGQIKYLDESIHSDLQSFQRHLCYVGHKPGVSHLLTLREIIQYEFLPPINQCISESLAEFQLQGLEEVPFSLLSAGQKRRVALMRLVNNKSPIWLLDEPFVALDSRGIKRLIDGIKNHLNNQGLIILTSHQRLPMHLKEYKEYRL